MAGTHERKFAIPSGPAHFTTDPTYAEVYSGKNPNSKIMQYETTQEVRVIAFPRDYRNKIDSFEWIRSSLDIPIFGAFTRGGMWTGKDGMKRVAALEEYGVDGVYWTSTSKTGKGDELVIFKPRQFVKPVRAMYTGERK